MDPRGLPQLSEWVTGAEADGYHLQGFMSSNVSVAEGVALADLYWPKFVEYRDRVFLGFKFDGRIVDEWYDRLEGDGSAVESVVNHVHLWDYFAISLDPEYAALPDLAEVIAEMWRAAAQVNFPGRDFEVAVGDGSGDYGPTLRLVGRW
ncbi:hypothetical protein [Streptomyces sp. NPDC090131]|uniref:hypothetical protein n=1 Tax=Streptomyces sp. NPDC090131 TaxID=3365954 RepID=UPI00381ECB7B